jgi:hypothetical protein
MSRLETILATSIPLLLYRAKPLFDAVEEIGRTIGPRLRICDARDEDSEHLETMLAETGPLLVVVGRELKPSVRAALDRALERKSRPPIIALSPASTPSAEMRSLFPLAMVASQVVES